MWGYIARGALFGAFITLCVVVGPTLVKEWKRYMGSWRVVSRQNLLRDLLRIPQDIGGLILIALWGLVFGGVIHAPIWLGGGVLGGMIGWLIFLANRVG